MAATAAKREAKEKKKQEALAARAAKKESRQQKKLAREKTEHRSVTGGATTYGEYNKKASRSLDSNIDQTMSSTSISL